MMRRTVFPLVVLAIGIAGCTTINSVNQVSGETNSQPAVELTSNHTVAVDTLGGAAALLAFGHPVSALGLPGEIFNARNAALLYVIYDPFAPNWTIKEQQLDGETFQISMRAKYFRTGGDGEAVQILKRRALQLQREKGFSTYRVLEYSEGVESSTPFSYRVSEGTIQLVKAP